MQTSTAACRFVVVDPIHPGFPRQPPFGRHHRVASPPPVQWQRQLNTTPQCGDDSVQSVPWVDEPNEVGRVWHVALIAETEGRVRIVEEWWTEGVGGAASEGGWFHPPETFSIAPILFGCMMTMMMSTSHHPRQRIHQKHGRRMGSYTGSHLPTTHMRKA